MKFRNVVRSVKSYGFKLGVPMPKKFPLMNVPRQDFAKARGDPNYERKTGKITARYIEKNGKIKVSRKDLIKADSWKIYVGDLVQVVSGKLVFGDSSVRLPEDKRQGKVLEVDRNRNMIKVEGIYKINKRIPNNFLMQGQTIEMHNWIHYSNVQLIDPSTQIPSKVSWKLVDREVLDSYKFPQSKNISWKRVAAKSGTIIPLPKEHLNRKKRDADDPEKGKNTIQCSTKREIQLSWSPSLGCDIPEEYKKQPNHY
eukprot:NODE_13_length_54415_cov_0.522424.p27 type:complete len:255 gc:universal NODE_13_length_54415_cov_0.522424:30594-29830(-)